MPPSITATARPPLANLTRDHWLAIACAISSALIHGYVALTRKTGATRWAFILAGLGFLAGIALFYISSDTTRKRLYLVGAIYTAFQFCIYILVNWPTDIDIVGIYDKTIQLVLIAILMSLYKGTPLLSTQTSATDTTPP